MESTTKVKTIKKKPTKEVETKKFTLEEAMEELKAKEQTSAKERKERLDLFQALIQEAMTRTKCTLMVDEKSPIGNPQIMAVSTE